MYGAQYHNVNRRMIPSLSGNEAKRRQREHLKLEVPTSSMHCAHSHYQQQLSYPHLVHLSLVFGYKNVTFTRVVHLFVYLKLMV